MNIETRDTSQTEFRSAASFIWSCSGCGGTSITEKDTETDAEELGRKHVQMNPACSHEDVEVIQLDSQAKRLQWIINRG